MNSITATELKEALATSKPPIVVDVRRQEAYLKATDKIAGARRGDPEQVSAWSNALPRADKLVVYCAHGHEVSQNVARSLAAEKRDVCFLEGGFAAWQSADGACDRKPAGVDS